jgi:syntaxin-binding protein 1
MIEDFIESQKKNKAELIQKDAGNIFLLILDRKFDILTPFIHDFYYQPLIYDLLNIKEHKVEKPGNIANLAPNPDN